jgi:hypothetical protein
MDTLNRKQPLTTYERVLVDFNLNHFNDLINKSIYLNSTNYDQRSANVNYGQYSVYGNYRYNNISYADHFAADIWTVTQSKKSEIKIAIQNSQSVSEEDRDFLLLILDLYLDPYLADKNENMNIKGDEFLLKYPNSKYSIYVKTTIINKYVTNKWGLNYEVAMGFHTSTEKIGSNFKSGFALGFGGGVTYKKFLMKLNIHVGPTSPKLDFRKNDTIWEKNHSSTITQFETSLGYVIAPNKKLSWIPSVGIGTTSITPSQGNNNDENHYEDVKYSAKLTYFTSLGIKYKLNSSSNSYQESHSYLMLNYRYSAPQFSGSYTGFTGDIHMITLSFGGFLNLKKRVM